MKISSEVLKKYKEIPEASGEKREFRQRWTDEMGLTTATLDRYLKGDECKPIIGGWIIQNVVDYWKMVHEPQPQLKD